MTLLILWVRGDNTYSEDLFPLDRNTHFYKFF